MENVREKPGYLEHVATDGAIGAEQDYQPETESLEFSSLEANPGTQLWNSVFKVIAKKLKGFVQVCNKN